MSVVGLDGKPIEQPTEYDLEVVAVLERALADAKESKASGVAICLVSKNDDTFDVDCYWHGRRLMLLAGASRLAHQINQCCDEAMEVIT